MGLDCAADRSIGVASTVVDPVSRRWTGIIIGVVRGGGGHLEIEIIVNKIQIKGIHTPRPG